MKALIAVVFTAAGVSGILTYLGMISPTSMVPPVLVALAFILVLLHLMNVSERRY